MRSMTGDGNKSSVSRRVHYAVRLCARMEGLQMEGTVIHYLH